MWDSASDQYGMVPQKTIAPIHTAYASTRAEAAKSDKRFSLLLSPLHDSIYREGLIETLHKAHHKTKEYHTAYIEEQARARLSHEISRSMTKSRKCDSITTSSRDCNTCARSQTFENRTYLRVLCENDRLAVGKMVAHHN